MKKPPAEIFTIQRKDSGSAKRFLATDDDGEKVWTTVRSTFDTFKTERAADTYVTFRMGRYADDCVVTRHPVH